MLDAVLHDLGRCRGVQTTTLLAEHGPPLAAVWPNNTVVTRRSREEELGAFCRTKAQPPPITRSSSRRSSTSYC